MRLKPLSLLVPFFGLLLLIFLAGCENPIMAQLLKPWRVKTYTITFNSNGGSAVASQSVGEGRTASRPEDPMKLFLTAAGLYLGSPEDCSYDFAGWHRNGSLYDFNAPVTENITLTAQWTEPATVPIPIDSVPANNVTAAVIYVNGSPATYTLLIDRDVDSDTQTLVQGVNLAIMGIGSERTIQYSGAADKQLFFNNINAPASLTPSLTLGNNITLRGIPNGTSTLVSLRAGTLTIKAGSKITGHTTSQSYAVSAANFIMEGGEISGNRTTSSLSYSCGGVSSGNSFDMSGGTISGNYSAYGGGNTPADLYISEKTSFNLSGPASIGALMLVWEEGLHTTITLAGPYTGTVAALDLLLGFTPDLLVEKSGYWANNPLITGSGYTVAASDIGRFTLGRFLFHEDPSRRIAGNALDSGHGNYIIGDSGEDMGTLLRRFARGEVLTVIQDIFKYLNSQSGGTTAADTPIPLNMRLALGSMTSETNNWQLILKALDLASKFVDLNLSACTMNGTVFNPAPNAVADAVADPNAGKGKIVSITLPTAATSLQAGTYVDAAFKNFAALTTFSGPGLTAISDYAFYNAQSLTTVSMPLVTNISNSAFQGCLSLDLTSLPAGVTYIGEDAFSGCTGLKLTALPTGVTYIGYSAFQNCHSLTQITLPALLVTIRNRAFFGCTNLVKVTFLGNIADVDADDIWAVEGFCLDNPFPGDLRDKYFAADGGIGTYTRPTTGDTGTWTKL